jgi:hypothetical protein
MSKMATFMNRILAVGAVAGMLASCTSSKIGLVNTAPANQSVAAAAPVAQEEAAPAAAQGAPAAEAYAATGEDVVTVATETAVSPLEKAAREQATVAAAPKSTIQKLSAAQRLVAKAVVKKLDKAQKKFDVKKEKARKAGKADPQVRTGIIIALVGLAVLVLGALLNNGLLWGLGGVGITVGLVIILLAALDVI